MDKERARSDLEDAVLRALEAGLSVDDVLAEVEYATQSHEDE